ncbi:MAG TPA: hypothetical protein PLD62_09705, partial [Candidatus Cloacimonadota bacterium]|nr:hypothetical protein [Candidatus Cloacimonadota bacterium]
RSLKKIKNSANENCYDRETILLINILLKPFGDIYDYNDPWSLGQLRSICEEARLLLPGKNEI